MTPAQRRASGVDAVGHSSVQPWSAGELFPCVIAVVERHCEGYTARKCCPEGCAFPTRSYELTLDGRSEEYATREDAEKVARGLMRDPEGRKQWIARAGLVERVHAEGGL